MSLTLPDSRQQEIVEEAAKASFDEVLDARPILLVGGNEMTQYLDNCQWVQGQDEYPITLDALFGVVLPRRYDGETVEFYVEVEGVVVPQMLAPRTLSGIDVGEDLMSTLLLAGTGGVHLERHTLNERVEYRGSTPSLVIMDAIKRGNIHDLSQVEIEPVDHPEINWVYRTSGDQSFGLSETLADILSRVDALGNEDEFDQQIPLLLRDTARNGFTSRVKRGLTPHGVTRVYNWRDLGGWKPPERKNELHSHVGVYRLLENGDEAYKIIVPVEYRGRGVEPRAGTIKWIPFADDTSAGPDRAQQRAYDGAERLARGEFEGQVELPAFDAILEKGDSFQVLEEFRDEEASWDRAWLFEITSTANAFDKSLGVLPAVVDYEGVLLHEDEIKVPAYIGIPPSTGGIALQPPAPYGLDDTGFWADSESQGDEPYLDITTADGIWVDEDAADGRAGFDEADGLWIEE